MSTNLSFPGRTLVALGAIAAMIALIGIDLATSEPIDPFDAPPPIALGSGQAPSGAHCTGA